MATYTHLFKQILGVTADNTSNNNTMIEHLSLHLEDFPDAPNQTRCFLHILNITAKAMLKQFDIPKPKNGVAMDNAARALASLAEDLDAEEQEAYDAQDCRDNEAEDPPLDRWIDYQEGLTVEEKNKIDLSIRPVWSMLTKVRVTLLCYLLAKVD
jgi:hypothetical protein